MPITNYKPRLVPLPATSNSTSSTIDPTSEDNTIVIDQELLDLEDNLLTGEDITNADITS